MIKKQYFLLLLFGLYVSFSGNSQTHNNLNIKSSFVNPPKIISYNREDFNSDPNFLSACENQEGSFIFGNNDGALYFDGAHWQKINLPNNSPVNSVIRAADNKIYVCGFNQFGTLEKNKYSQFFYKSLIPKYHLEEENFENLWQVRELKNHLIIRTFSKLVVLFNNKTTSIPSKKSFIHSEKVGDNYFVQDIDFGIYKLNIESSGLSLIWDINNKNEDIKCMLPTPDPNIVTLISGAGNVYIGNIEKKTLQKKNNLFEGVKNDLVTCGIANSEFEYIIGTQSSKIIVINRLGMILRDNQLQTGLSNAKINSLVQLSNGNIWVLQNNALSLLDYKTPFTKIFDQASVYDILLKKNTIYLATNNGIYYSNFSDQNNFSSFSKIENLQGQAWAIQDLDGDIIISHDTKLYKLANKVAQSIGTEDGFWKTTKIKDKKDLYLGSNYKGLYLIEKKELNWSILHKIEGFNESTRDILADYEPNTYWVCHGYKGVYKIHINPDYSRIDAVEHFTDKNGFKSPFNINVFNWNKKIVFTSNTGIYTYNNYINKFELYNPLNKILDPSKNTRKLIENNGKTWFIQDDEVGYFIGTNPKLYKDLFINLKGTFNRGMESIYPLSNNRVLLGTNNGLYLYYLSENKVISPTIISKITYTKNQSKFLVEINSNDSNIEIPNETDLLRFEFASPKMLSSTQTLYSYKLENLDQNWSPWQKTSFKEYTHLNPGTYVFVVRSKNLAGLIGKYTSLKFNVLPKWHQTNLFYFFIIVITIFLIFQIIKYVRGKIALERLKLKLEFEKSRQLLSLELEKLKIKQEKESIHNDKLILEEDIVEKSKELANYTLLLSQKKDLFDELKIDLKKLREILKSDESRKKVTEIFQKINYHGISEEYMEIFDVNFEKINHPFYEKLLKIDSKLTKNELRLCAFVKMNLSNKEIAPLLNISLRGVENARYKIRKKLNVPQESNFTVFLNELHKNNYEL